MEWRGKQRKKEGKHNPHSKGMTVKDIVKRKTLVPGVKTKTERRCRLTQVTNGTHKIEVNRRVGTQLTNFEF